MNLPKFNQLAYTFERFVVPDTPGVWPKTFIVPDHRIVLPSAITMLCSVDPTSATQRIQCYIGGGAPNLWVHQFDTILPAGANYQLTFHPGPSSPSAAPFPIDFDFTIPDNIFLYALDGLTLQLTLTAAGDDIVSLTVCGRSWIL